MRETEHSKQQRKKREDIIVVGGGASGMAAAITAAQGGANVLLIEKLDTCGKKLLATGNGRCNFTNVYQGSECYRGDNAEFVCEALSHFTQEDTLRWFEEMGVLSMQREGYYYPASGQAASVRNALLRQLEQYNVMIHTGEQVKSVRRTKDGYEVRTLRGSYAAAQVILSAGGSAAPVHGTNGDGYYMAELLGLSVISPLPALTSLVLKGDFMKGWTGVRVRGHVTLYGTGDRILAEDGGELQMVDYGISGIPVFQISRFAARELADGGRPYLRMDIAEERSVDDLKRLLEKRRQKSPQWTDLDVLEGMIHRKLAEVLMRSMGLEPGRKMGQWTEQETDRLAERMKNWKLGIRDVSGFEKAQVTCGGIDTSQVDAQTMEVKGYPGLYVTGELLDVDGMCGGYNLQWAWTSGIIAGRSVNKQSLFTRQV